jgi:iron complex outermembrane receptor protein
MRVSRLVTNRVASLIAVAMGVCGPGAALAADATQPAAAPGAGATPAAQNDDTGGLEEVLVTARFKSESLQSAPIAITAVTGDQLEARGYVNITQVASIAPNVNLEQAGSGFGKLAFVSIRGIGQSDFKYTFEPGVAFYIDDVYFGTAFGSIFDLTDVDSVEVLRGPQGTLFGKNTEGGAVRLLTKKPGGDGSGYVEAGYGDFSRQRFKGALDVSLVPDHLFLRVSAGSNRSDGYMDVYDFACANPSLAGKLKPATFLNDCKLGTYGGDDVQVGRVALRWLSGEGLEINLSGDLMDDHGEAPANKIIAIALPPNPSGTAGVPGSQISNTLALFSANASVPQFGVPLDGRFLTSSPFTTYNTFTDPLTGVVGPDTSTLYSYGFAGTIDWDTPSSGVHVKSISAYRRYHGEFAQDTSGAPITGNMPINFLSHHQFSQEVQVSGRALSDALDWTLGAYYLDSQDVNSGIVDQPSNVGGRGILFLTNDPAASKDESGFVHANYRISERWGLELGGRYSHEAKSYTFYRYEPNLKGIVPAGLFPTNNGNYLAGFAPPYPIGNVAISRFDPKVGLSYQWSTDVMSYVQFATGYKSGGFNPRPLTRSQVTSFGPEKVSSYEVGLKSEWFEHKLRANVAAFVSDYKDLQLPVATVDPGTGLPAFLTQSVGSVRISGAELEIVARPVRGFTIDGSLGFLNFDTRSLGGAAYSPVTNPGGPTVHDVPPLTPKWKGNVGMEYALSLGDWGTLTPRADYTYQTAVFNDAQNELISRQAAYGILNAHLTWQAVHGGWQASVLISNLTDKMYYLTEQNLLSTYDVVSGQPGRPREFLFSIRKNF